MSEKDLSEVLFVSCTSKTKPTHCQSNIQKNINYVSCDEERLKYAKETVENAIASRKIFKIQKNYPALSRSLKERGWIENVYKLPVTQKIKGWEFWKSDEDSDDDNCEDDDQSNVHPCEKEDTIMTTKTKDAIPTFIWTESRYVIDYPMLTEEQIVNHYYNTESLITKVGLTTNIKNVPWFVNADPDSFFPRSYRLSHEEEKHAFIDDFRLTACMNILKIAAEQNAGSASMEDLAKDISGGEETKYESKETKEETIQKEEEKIVCTNLKCTLFMSKETRKNVHFNTQERHAKLEKQYQKYAAKTETGIAERTRSKTHEQKKQYVQVPITCLEHAMQQCKRFLEEKEHKDIGVMSEDILSDAQWDKIIQWFYQLVHEAGVISNVSKSTMTKINYILNRLKAKHPQYDLDGIRNVLIVKPGTKSNGMGIKCYDHLEDMLKLVDSRVFMKDNKYIVQKYIESPLLVYNCKIDIRQWFLVTDWNPLTIWFYQDSYLRFCSQQFTLDDFDETIHLSNYEIQKLYKNGPRQPDLPSDNMWSHEEFKKYIKNKKNGNLWDKVIYPGMKQILVNVCLCTQDIIENRKSSFELYGADFMLTEDYKPWLMEINYSPSMESSSAVTARLCTNVLEDTVKVVIDRKHDKNCDIGRYELGFKQPLVRGSPQV